MFDPMTIGILILVVVGGYFLMIRPANKRMREQQQQVASIQPGTRVMLTSGIFGTVRHVGDKQMVVELAPDCLVTVVRGAVSKTIQPEDEEFEFEDTPGEFDQAVDQPAEVESGLPGPVQPAPVTGFIPGTPAAPVADVEGDDGAWSKPAGWDPDSEQERIAETGAPEAPGATAANRPHLDGEDR